ncbi:hypothetical protein RA2_01352 [Roseovarius sp. A-2]|uniref:zinc-ribbon domain-containing protein n=1 Tax=Roseovarius sp. A-2 TaxID=1570360 RepID=UPI0009B53D3A|nr:zinc-ribbon domain-containing protein [Roseovarius sp. A-2]GAW34304.1 hypothetical protein RA2_01352 [Roseovarius sp. A-2]
MRLTCPNCGAQYEVPEAVIPTTGRDVQCSNCGDTWFQNHPDHAPAEPDEQVDEPGISPDPVAQDAPAEQAVVPEPPPAPQQPSAQRSLDPNVAGILREEAERERAARAAETAGAVETQPDLGLADPEPTEDERSRQARARMERLRGADPVEPSGMEADSTQDTDAPAQDDIDPSSRRNLLPDIEEINSSLSSVGERNDPVPAALPDEIPLQARSGGFRSGFRLALITFVLATIVYLTAPSLAQMIPAAEAPLAQYVEAVDAARVQLNELVARVLAGMGG